MFQALLFGVWHIVTPLHNLIDGDINTGSFIALGVGYIVLAGMMGIKWGLLHVITESGVDEMMIIRVVIAQLLSFTAVLLVWKKQKKKGG